MCAECSLHSYSGKVRVLFRVRVSSSFYFLYFELLFNKFYKVCISQHFCSLFKNVV